MKSLTIVSAAVGALALGGLVTAVPAQARGFGPGFAGGLVAGAIVGGAVSSAYAYAPGPGYAYGGYGWEPGYYARSSQPYETFGVYDESQHGGQPSYSRPLD